MTEQITTDEGTDKLLVLSVRASDRTAKFEFDRRWRPRVLHLARSILHDEHLAQDAAQLALWRAQIHLDRYDESRPFEPWILRIAGNAARDLRRKVVRERTQLSATGDDSVLDDVAAPPNDGDGPVVCPKEKEALNACMERLDDPHRTAATLFGIGFSLKESGVILGKPKSTVQTWLGQAMAQLRRCLAGKGFVRE